MKSDSERKKFYKEPLHQRKSRLHVHLSKTLRSKLKTKKRAVLIHKSDKVKILRGPGMGKEGRVTRVNTNRRKIYTDAVLVKNARGKEVPVALEPSNLLLIELEPTDLRKEIFKEDAFIKEKPKEEKKTEPNGKNEAKETKHEVKHEAKHESKEHAEHVHHSHEKQEEHKSEQKDEHKSEHKPEHKTEHPDHPHPTHEQHDEKKHSEHGSEKHHEKHDGEHKHSSK
ncbi:50S ribosomal protein L24 [Candidatus Micrarchaeota archaeon]|nr:50S ribosomal protein L24 [Candidatus Micrarchaeota archaeon]